MKVRTSINVLLGTLVALLLISTVAMAAAPTVVTVPWRGLLLLDHETYNGKQIFLKGVASGLVAGATASWNPGDGSAAKPATVNIVNGFDFDLGVTHTYPNSAPGTPFVATLTVCNPPGAAADCASATYRVVVRARTLDVEINIGIDEGLWYLHKQQTRSTTASDGSWSYSGDLAPTASAVQAFQINNHFETNNPNLDPYADTVKRGLKYVFSRLSAVAITTQTMGNPDSNGNGYGVTDTFSGDQPYEQGMIMDAIVSSKTPNAITTTGPAPSGANPGILGRTYKDIVQDMVDMIAYGQNDPSTGTYRGGWRYGWNYGSSDNSACQWSAIGILAARDLWGCTVPPWVYSENLTWLTNSAIYSGANAYAYGYTGCCSYLEAGSPSALVQAVMDAVPKTDAVRWSVVEDYLASVWKSWYMDTTDYYRLFAMAKAMRLALPAPIVTMSPGTANAIDWFKADCANPAACNATTDKWGVARTILRDQDVNGFFNTSYWVGGVLNHAWGVIILTGTLQLEPVAVATANPNPGAVGVPIHFDGSGSYHTDPSKSIVLYEWFFSDGSTATGVTANHAFACAVLPCTYTATLQVTDNTTPAPLVATTTIQVRITNPPHPPTANAGGPYIACINEVFTLDGSKSTDVDIPLGDSITAYGWELNFIQPLNFTDATGVKPTTSYPTAGRKDIGLQVTDNSAAIFGGQNLTDQNFTTADIWNCGCFSNLIARAKPGKIDITWAPVTGAASYEIYRSTVGPNSGFVKIASGYVSGYAAYADLGLVNGTQYWYRIVPNAAPGAAVCNGSPAATAKPMIR